MATYVKPEDISAADSLDAQAPAAPDQGAATDEQEGQAEPAGEQEPRGDTFFLPPTFPGADGLAQGDTVTLRVVGSNEQGELEVENVSREGAGGEGDAPWANDLKQSMA